MNQQKRQSIRDFDPLSVISEATNRQKKEKVMRQIRPSMFLNNLELIIPETNKRRDNILIKLPTLQETPQIPETHTEIKKRHIKGTPSDPLPIFRSQPLLPGLQKLPSLPQSVLRTEPTKRQVQWRQSIQVLDFINGILTKEKMSDELKPLRKLQHRQTKANIKPIE